MSERRMAQVMGEGGCLAGDGIKTAQTIQSSRIVCLRDQQATDTSGYLRDFEGVCKTVMKGGGAYPGGVIT